eukprot:scpid92263/ scgid35491/ 
MPSFIASDSYEDSYEDSVPHSLRVNLLHACVAVLTSFNCGPAIMANGFQGALEITRCIQLLEDGVKTGECLSLCLACSIEVHAIKQNIPLFPDEDFQSLKPAIHRGLLVQYDDSLPCRSPQFFVQALSKNRLLCFFLCCPDALTHRAKSDHASFQPTKSARLAFALRIRRSLQLTVLCCLALSSFSL